MRFVFVLVALILSSAPVTLTAGEGMWLPLLLSKLNEAEMQEMGMKMTAEDIYSVNNGSLKDAIVSFGGFCTGEVISYEGLLLTNHHCGYGQIQSHSSLENNYLQDGFWAATKADEIPNPGLFVTFIESIEDVTEKVMADINPKLRGNKRRNAIEANLAALKESLVLKSYQDVVIKPFFHGNQYFMFITKTYSDIRLVGAPPSSIGKFGADTDNWEWPRHTGDFALFRIYAGPDNEPADFSPENTPFKPKKALPVSLDGVEEGDFTLIFGFPGRTDEYLPSVAIDQRVNLINPIRIGIRDRSLAVLDEAMRNDPEDRIKYAAKQSRIANAWKKWKGESQGVLATDGIGRKQALEAEFSKLIAADPKLTLKYGNLMDGFKHLFLQIEPLATSRNYIIEIMWQNVELFRLGNRLRRLLEQAKSEDETLKEQAMNRISNLLNDFYKDYNAEVDQAVAKAVLPIYFENMAVDYQAPYARDEMEFSGGRPDLLVDALYDKSFLTKPDVALKILRKRPAGFLQQLEGDYLFQFVNGVMAFSETQVFDEYNKKQRRLENMMQRYMDGLMTVFPDRRFYPDANSTMRVTYGKVEGYNVGDSLSYDYQTYLDGLIDKYVPGDYEFDVPARLRELHTAKDYGQYATKDGRLPVCFLGSNHTTGGNSGSPAIDANGNLIGLNFDRTWHGTMSDINYDSTICRNIMVDARYILFVIDKFAGAGHLVEEMELVHPKQ